MQFTEDQQMIQQLARDFAESELAPIAAEIDQEERIPKEIIEKMAEIGFTALNVPEEYGGPGLDTVCKVLVVSELARQCASTAEVIAVHTLVNDIFLKHGTEAQKQKYLVPGIQGAYRGSLAFTEPGTGSDPKQLTTGAKGGNGKYLISGTKRFISNAAYKGPIVVVARDEGADTCTAYIVEKFCKGYSLSKPWDKIGLHGSHVYDVFLDDVEVTKADILGGYGKGFDLLIGTTTYGKLAFSAVFTGIMDGAYDLAVKYAKEKLHRGSPISKFPSMQDKAARVAANTLSSRLMLYKAAEDADTITNDIRRVQASAALVKGYIADLAVETCTMALNMHASYGVTAEYQVERFLRDAVIAPNIEGSADIQRLIAGSYILKSAEHFL